MVNNDRTAEEMGLDDGPVTIHYSVWAGRNQTLVTKEKAFRTEAAMRKWVDDTVTSGYMVV